MTSYNSTAMLQYLLSCFVNDKWTKWATVFNAMWRIVDTQLPLMIFLKTVAHFLYYVNINIFSLSYFYVNISS